MRLLQTIYCINYKQSIVPEINFQCWEHLAGSEVARKPSIRVMTNILYTFREMGMKY